MYQYSINRESEIKKIAERENTSGFTEIDELIPFVAKQHPEEPLEEDSESEY